MIRRMLGNRLYLSALGVAMVFVVAVVYLFAAVLDQPLTSRPAEVKVQLANTGGLFKGSSATYRGVKVGRVTDMELTAEGAQATVALTSDIKIPASTIARVRSLSPVGEQYLDFAPTADGGPYLEDGAVIAASSTELPKSLASTVVAVNGVLRQIDDRKLHTLLHELAVGLTGTGDDIGLIVDQSELLLNELDAAWPQTESLLTNAGSVLDIGTSQAGDLRELASSSKTFAKFLKGYTPELIKTLEKAPQQLLDVQELIADWAKVFPAFLPVTNQLIAVLLASEPQLRELLAKYPDGINTLSTLLRNGELHLDLSIDESEECSYGTPATDPKSGRRTPLQERAGCNGLARGMNAD